jgi:hypothetical protein
MAQLESRHEASDTSGSSSQDKNAARIWRASAVVSASSQSRTGGLGSREVAPCFNALEIPLSEACPNITAITEVWNEDAVR